MKKHRFVKGKARTISGYDEINHFIQYFYKRRPQLEALGCAESVIERFIKWKADIDTLTSQLADCDNPEEILSSSEIINKVDFESFSVKSLPVPIYNKWRNAYSLSRKRKGDNMVRCELPQRTINSLDKLKKHRKYANKGYAAIINALANFELEMLNEE